MKHLLKRTWAEINLDFVKYNYLKVREITNKNAKVMVVVKADGYGHGDVIIAKALEDIGADWFGVSNIEEAILLRQGGISCDILIFGVTPVDMVNALDKWSLTQTVYSEKYANELNDECIKQNVSISCHLKIDTGMGRIGLVCNDIKNVDDCVCNIENIYKSCKNLKFNGIFTHFSSADQVDADAEAYTKMQFMIFKAIYQKLENNGINTGIKHCANSATTIMYEDMHLDMVRVGLLLYGLKPEPNLNEKLKLKAAMTLKSKIALVKYLEKGSYISYGRNYKAMDKIKVATVPIGYADGYFRELSNCGVVEINGRLTYVLGNICMDQMMIDVTGIDVKEGDVVTLFGDSRTSLVTADTLAKIIGTINYEIITVLGKRVPRLYIKDGKKMLVTTYKGMEYSV